MKKIFLLITLNAVILLVCCNRQAGKNSQEATNEDTVFAVKDTIWLYVKAQSVHVREKPELLSEPLGVLYYGDSVHGWYIQDSVWFGFPKNGADAFLKTEYLTSLPVKKDTAISMTNVKKELRRFFSRANVGLKNGQFFYPDKRLTITIPNDIKTIELGKIVYSELEKLNQDHGLGGTRLCTDISADRSDLYTSTAKKGMKMTFYSLGALGMQFSNVIDTSATLSVRIMSGHVKFISGAIK
ncbi:MAG: hypothetical protein LBK94_03845 [Prevotellaceae bacterium]|jgi:hypothetical protein|nr:hypothetical protein [Prevotellaceae bacterium]